MAKDGNGFYEKMLEAKKRKKLALEQQQLRAEFEAHPERYTPELPPIVFKTEAEQKLDAAFNELKAKLRSEAPPTEQDRIAQAFQRIQDKSQGL